MCPEPSKQAPLRRYCDGESAVPIVISEVECAGQTGSESPLTSYAAQVNRKVMWVSEKRLLVTPQAASIPFRKQQRNCTKVPRVIACVIVQGLNPKHLCMSLGLLPVFCQSLSLSIGFGETVVVAVQLFVAQNIGVCLYRPNASFPTTRCSPCDDTLYLQLRSCLLFPALGTACYVFGSQNFCLLLSSTHSA